MLRPGLAVLVVGVLCSCDAGTERDALDDVGRVRSQVDSVWSGLAAAMTAGDTTAVATFYTDSAYFAETGAATARGRSAIVSATAGVFACCRYLESKQVSERFEVIGDHALQFGTYRDVIQPNGQAAIAFYGRFDAVLERDSIGRWRISRVTVIRDSSAQLSSRAP